MTFEQALIKMLRAYWKDEKGFENMSSSKGRKYNKKYFDGIEASVLSPKDQSKNSKKLKGELK